MDLKVRKAEEICEIALKRSCLGHTANCNHKAFEVNNLEVILYRINTAHLAGGTKG